MLDIGGFFTSADFLAQLASIVATVITTIITGLLGGIFGVNGM